jgi:hypothetical protein
VGDYAGAACGMKAAAAPGGFIRKPSRFPAPTPPLSPVVRMPVS